MKLHPSKFVKIVELTPEVSILLHTILGNLDLVYKETADAIKSKEIDSISTASQHLLYQRSYLVHSIREDEYYAKMYIRAAHEFVSQKRSSSEYIMLLFSYLCNFGCDYCYQNHLRPEKEKKKLLPRDIDFLFTQGFSQINDNISWPNTVVTLYGGEPLLATNRKSIDQTLYWAHKLGFKVEAITNGFNLDQYIGELGSSPGKISSIQITLDGIEHEHNSTRILKGGGGTFERIIENIQLALRSSDVRVKLRCHYLPEQNSREILEQSLREYEILENENVSIYYSPIQDYGSNIGTSIHNYEYDSRSNSKYDSIKDKLMSVIFADSGWGFMQTSYCMRSHNRGFVVDSDLNVYKCYEEAGHPEYIAGTFEDHKFIKDTYFEKAQLRSLLHQEAEYYCQNKMLCSGGCATLARHSKGSEYLSSCDCKKNDQAIRSILRDEIINKVGNIILTKDVFSLNFKGKYRRLSVFSTAAKKYMSNDHEKI